MNSAFASGAFGAGNPADGLWQVMDQLRGSFDRRGPGPRKSRGDVRAAVLVLLAEEPMHGYQIIREIEKRSAGAWKPSAGSVYPTLQLFADEGLVRVEESGGRKTYALTDEGEAQAADASVPWGEEPADRAHPAGALAKAGVDLAHAVGQVARTGSAEQVESAVEALTETRRRVYAILAEG